MSAAGEFFGECGDVVRVATTQAEFDLAGWQFDSDESGFRAGDGQALVDEAFGVGGDGTGFGEVLSIHLQPDQPTIGVRDGVRQCATGQSQTRQRQLFVYEPVHHVRHGAHIHQRGGNSHGAGHGGGETEPAGVRGNCGVQPVGGGAVEGDAQRFGQLENQLARGSGGDILEFMGIQLIRADVVVNHDSSGRHTADDVGHGPQLLPCAGVNDDDGIGSRD